MGKDICDIPKNEKSKLHNLMCVSVCVYTHTMLSLYFSKVCIGIYTHTHTYIPISIYTYICLYVCKKGSGKIYTKLLLLATPRECDFRMKKGLYELLQF